MVRVAAFFRSPALRGAYEEAMGKMRRQLTLAPVGRPIVPEKVSRLAAELLKTRIAHGYCTRHESHGACPYANICEPATTTPRRPSSRPPSPTNSPTSRRCKPTLSIAAGPARQSGTVTSPQRCKVTSTGSAEVTGPPLHSTPTRRAG
ncbi:MAG: hypothetical protein ACXVY5_09045 [Gaiellales bacterium]